MKASPYAGVNRLLESLLSGLRGILHERLVGLYLYGSLTAGDFDPGGSDVDLLAVTSSGLTGVEFDALGALHQDLARNNPEWEDRVDVSYLPVTALRTFRTERSPMAVISPGEPFHMTQAGKEWLVNWYAVRAEGVALCGPPADSLIGPITREEFSECVRGYAAELQARMEGTPGRKEQAYAVLSLCRALHLRRRGEQVSKRRAALWAQEELPAWSGLIRSALAWRDAWRREEDIDHAATRTQVIRFAGFVMEEMAD